MPTDKNLVNNLDVTKRFLLFAGHSYYPNGGASDFIACFDTLNEAVSYAKENTKSISERTSYADDIWYNVLDMQTGEVTEGHTHERIYE